MFESKAHQKAFEKVGKYLKRSFGGTFVPRPDVPSYVGTGGSALVEVWVYPWADDAVVNVRSCCVMDMGQIPQDCLRYLLDQNFGFVFGAFSLDKDGDINFEHTLLASKLDPKELEASVKAVQVTADKYDDEITKRWGGVTGREKVLQIARQIADQIGPTP